MSYLRLLSRLYNTPLAIEQGKLDVITSNVTLKLLAGEAVTAFEPVKERKDSRTQSNKTSVVKVFDSLVARNGAGDSGITSYESIQNRTKEAILSGANRIIYHIDSPGGEVHGMFGLANYIKSISGKYGIQTIGFVEGQADSAAYIAVASAVDKLYSTKYSMLGSIGAIMTLIDVTNRDEQNGVKHILLRSKEEKALYNPHEVISEAVLEQAKNKLAVVDNMINSSVSSVRPQLTLEALIGFKGNSFFAEEALELGLFDSYAESIDEVIESTSSKKSFSINSEVSMDEVQELQARLAKATVDIESMKASHATELALAVKAEQERILGILEAANTFNISATVAQKRIKANSSVAEAISIFEDIQEVTQTGKGLDSTGADGASITATTAPRVTEADAGLSGFLSNVYSGLGLTATGDKHVK